MKRLGTKGLSRTAGSTRSGHLRQSGLRRFPGSARTGWDNRQTPVILRPLRLAATDRVGHIDGNGDVAERLKALVC